MLHGKIVPLNQVIFKTEYGGVAFEPPFTGPHSKAITSDVVVRLIKHLKSVSDYCTEEYIADEAKDILELFGVKP